jgi:hypothetical protein
MNTRITCVVVGLLSLALSLVPRTLAQTSTESASALPRLVRFGGTAKDLNGNPLTGVVGVTFALYNEQTGGAALWLETQNVTADTNGHYTVLLGSTKPDGLPAELFTSEQARWVGVQVSGQAEQPRVLLVSAPYALKAGDAETIGGLPPSAFVMATPQASGSAAASGPAAKAGAQGASPATATDVTTTGGVANYLPVFSGAATIIDSVVYQSGSGSTARIGIGTTTPSSTLEVEGSGEFTGSVGIVADTRVDFSGLNKGSYTPAIRFGTGNTGEAIASDRVGTVNVQGIDLYTDFMPRLSITHVGSVGIGTTKPAFPLDVVGNINSSTGFTLGGLPFDYGSYGNQNAFLGFAGNGSEPANMGNTGVGVYALTSLTTGPATTATGAYALEYNTTGTANTATGYAALNANSTGSWNVGNGGFALYSNSTGSGNTATGYTGLYLNTTGGNNTATGWGALYSNTAGSNNTAVGYLALGPSTGSGNTALGYDAGLSVDNSQLTQNNNTFLGFTTAYTGGYALTNATAIGAYAEVTQSNAMVLGPISGTNNCTAANNCGSVNVGIGTTAPAAKLTVSGSETTANGFGAAIQLTNAASGGMDYYFRVGATGTNTGAGNMSIANDDEYIMTFTPPGYVGIKTPTPTNIFTIVKGGGEAIADGWSTYSSRRWKTNIQTLQGALEKVGRLRGVSYDLKGSGKHEVGVIAEEVGAVVPEVVTYENNGKDARGVDYTRLTALLIEATKEQQVLIRKQQQRIRTQEAQIKAQQSEIRAQQTEGQIQKSQIAQLMSQVTAIQASLRTNGQSRSEIRTVKAQAPVLQQ